MPIQTKADERREITRESVEIREDPLQVEVPNTPEEEAQRAAFHQRWLAEQTAEVTRKNRRDQALTLLDALDKGTATNRQQQTALAAIVRALWATDA